MMETFIESAVTLQQVAAVTRTTVAAVEAAANELSLFIGADWAGKPALSTVDAAAYVSGDAQRASDHARAHARWRAATETWESAREQARERAFTDAFNAARRRGTGDPQAAHQAAQEASVAIIEYEKSTPQPVFADTQSPRLSKRVKELLSK